jgi:hypothetical protein
MHCVPLFSWEYCALAFPIEGQPPSNLQTAQASDDRHDVLDLSAENGWNQKFEKSSILYKTYNLTLADIRCSCELVI